MCVCLHVMYGCLCLSCLCFSPGLFVLVLFATGSVVLTNKEEVHLVILLFGSSLFYDGMYKCEMLFITLHPFYNVVLNKKHSRMYTVHYSCDCVVGNFFE